MSYMYVYIIIDPIKINHPRNVFSLINDEIFSIAKTLRCVPLETHAIVILKSMNKIFIEDWAISLGEERKRSLF